MKKNMIATVLLILLSIFFGVSSHAAIRQCDFSNPKNHTVDGWDLSQFIANYGGGGSDADVNRDGVVDSKDVAHFALFFGKSRLPNILLIIADDVGLDMTTDMYDGLIADLLDQYGPGPGGLDHPSYSNINHGVENGRPASTPKLNTLAQQGMRFSNAWAQPFCSPTRASIITGMFATKTNVAAFDLPMTTNHTTFVQRLKDEANYSTAIFGKWHLAGGTSTGYNEAMPQMMGFEIFKGNLDAAPTPGYWDHYYQVQDGDTVDPAAKPPNGATPYRFLPGIEETTYAPVVRAADTIEWINQKQTQDPDKPWFAWLAFNLAHITMPVPAEGKKYYHVPNADTMDDQTKDEILAERGGCGGVPGTYYSGAEVGGCTAAQLMRAMTNAMDTVIGKVLEAVDSIPSDTYVIFIGDNGTWSNNMDNMYITYTGRGKITAYESGALVPLVIKGPGIAGNSEGSEFVHAVDLFPTILEFAGLEVNPEGLVYTDYNGNPTNLDGVPLTSILFGTGSTVRDPIEDLLLTEVDWTSFGTRTRRVGARNLTYKVMCEKINTASTTCKFYNLVDDPLEEYELTKPSCTGWPIGSQEWHYCYLLDAINTNSVLSIP
ncbi:MAG: sulfatase-like hydrolase/transferase [Desulfatiglandaceae bacterium]